MIIIRMPNKGLYLQAAGFNTMLRDRYVPEVNYDDTLLCWGCTVPTGVNRVLNNGQAFKMTAHKARFRQKMTEIGVRIPQTFYSPDDLRLVLDGQSLFIGRPDMHHSGLGLQEVRDEKSLADSVNAGSTYWSRYIPKTREIRVFVAKNRVWAISEKILPEDKQAQIAWNWEQGSNFEILRWHQWPTKAAWYAELAARATGLAIGSYDLIYSEGYWYMLEGNTSTQIQGHYKVGLLESIIKHYDEAGVEPYAVGDYSTSYKAYKHPALEGE